MADAALDALYQEIILDHYRRPRNYHPMPEASCTAEGKNPSCGDQLTVWLRVEGDVVADVSFQGVGCAISRASASLMTQAVKGKTRDEAVALFENVRGLVTGGAVGELASTQLGSLRALAGVSRFPMRVKCASLAWHAMKSAMDGLAPAGFIRVDGVSAANLAPGELRGVTLREGLRICVGNHAGALFAVRDVCPHAEFPLSEGALYATGELECCFHGARFNCLSGAVLRGPAEDPLTTYEVQVIDGVLWIRA